MEKEVKVVGSNRQGDFELECDGHRFSLFLGKDAVEPGDVLKLSASEKEAKKAKKGKK